jgi:hypothetical protein
VAPITPDSREIQKDWAIQYLCKLEAFWLPVEPVDLLLQAKSS